MAGETEPQQHDRGADDRPPAMPGWVKASAVVAVVVLLVAAAVMLLSGGEHGPGRHFEGAPAGALATSAWA